MTPLQLLVVEDQPDVREKLAALADLPDFSQVQFADSLSAANQVLSAFTPDVVLLDIGLPDGNGLTLMDSLFQRSSRCEVLVFTIFGDEKRVLDALNRGARGYLLKDTPVADIPSLIHQQLEGGAPLSPAISAYLLKQIRSPSVPNPLTSTEQTVLTWLAKGLTYEEAATMLRVKASTVASHTKSIYRKMGVRSRGEAVFEAQKSGWLGS